MTTVVSRQVMIEGRPASVWLGGQGEPLLLVHGAWGGAALHWAPVWDRLAERFQIVAPDLPGLTEGTAEGPRSFQGFGGWLERLLDTQEISSAWCVGNSFGAALVWRFASQAPARCRGLVLVNGAPPPTVPAPIRRLLALPPLRQLLTAMLRWNAFSRTTIPRAFVDPRRAPAELTRVLARRNPPQLQLTRDVILGDDPRVPPPRGPLLLLWGGGDRLMGGGPGAARRLHRSLPGSQLTFISAAGHLPQVERPEGFVEALATFLTSRPPTERWG
jgi:pimeloyl-ACP methyl ester carboxylesterase